MQGGDRMLHHGYARKYSEHLARFNEEEKLVIAEFGIFRGIGLAIWCDLFSNSRIIGLDIDLSYMNENMNCLVKKGAFSRNQPELHRYDQFVHSEDLLGEILQGDTMDICIDDGCHFNEAIMCTMRSVMPHMSSLFLYFVEDNRSVLGEIEQEYPGYQYGVRWQSDHNAKLVCSIMRISRNCHIIFSIVMRVRGVKLAIARSSDLGTARE